MRYILIGLCKGISWCIFISWLIRGRYSKAFLAELRQTGMRHAPGLWIIQHLSRMYKHKSRIAWWQSICEKKIGHDVTYGDTGWSVGSDMLDCHCRWCDKIVQMPIRETHIGMSEV